MTFEDIYQRNAWNGRESLSGPGSDPIPTERARAAVQRIVMVHGITSVLDLGCGDCAWMPDVPGYLGLDVSPTAIDHARANRPGWAFEVWDQRDGLPSADLVISRDMMQHLPTAAVVEVLALILASGSPLLLASTFRGAPRVDIEEGDARPIDLEGEPFNLHPPEELIPDGYDYSVPRRIRDPAKFLGLWRLRP